MKATKSVFNFQTFFTLFLFSSQYKNASFFIQDPDITILLAIILIPWAIILYKKGSNAPNSVIASPEGARQSINPNSSMVFRICGSRQPLRGFAMTVLRGVHVFHMNLPISLLLLFTIWLLGSVYWSPQNHYAYSKALRFACFTMPACFMALLVIATEEWRLKDFLLKILIFSSFVMLASFYIYFFDSARVRLNHVLGTNYLVTGQTIGCGLLILFVMNLEYRKNSNLYLALLALSGLMTFIILNLGARGPVISAFIAVIILLLMWTWQVSERTLLFKHFGYFLGISTVLFVSLKLIPTPFHFSLMYRIQNLIHPTTGALNDRSLLERIEYYQSAWRCFLEHPLKGVGIGGWPAYHGLGNIDWHPHNIFLETLCELGLIGFSIIALLLGYILLAFWQLRKTPISQTFLMVFGLFIFSGINALKTGDFNDNILLFVCIGLAVTMVKKVLTSSDKVRIQGVAEFT